MQVKHEIQLIESINLKSEEFSFSNTQQKTLSKKTLDTYTINQSKLTAISYIACCPIGNLIAVYLNSSQQIVLIDTRTHSKIERFPLKPCDKKFSKHSFTLKGIDYSPDGLKLAIAQSDCIIYIYKLPNYINQLNETTLTTQNTTGIQNSTSLSATSSSIARPTITGKFVCTSPVSCLIWTECGIFFGTQDGKIKLISITSTKSSSLSQTTTNENQLLANSNNLSASSQNTNSSSSKVITVYNSPKGFMPISLAYKYPVVSIGFINNHIIFLTLSGSGVFQSSGPNVVDLVLNNNLASSSNSSSQIVSTTESQNSIVNRRGSSQATILATTIGSIQHSCPPYNLLSIQNNIICSSGSDGRITFHSLSITSNNSNNNQNVNFLQNIDIKEDILACDYSIVNEIIAIITKNRLLFLKNDLETSSWQLQPSFIELKQTHSITTIRWLKEGTQLVLGTLSGSVELFQCSWNKQASIGEQLEICHIAKNRVRITDRARNLLATYKSQHDIKRVNLLNNGQSVIIWTTNSLLLASINCSLQSEIQWQSKNQKSAKFSFKHLGFVLLFNQSTKELSIIKLGQDFILYTINYHQKDVSNLNERLICVRQYPSVHKLTTNLLLQQQRNSITTNNNDISISPIRQRSTSGLSTPKYNRSREPSLINQQVDVSMMYNDIVGDYNSISINERLAYVIESNTLLLIVDLKIKSIEFSQKFNNNEQIEYLELSNTTNYLIFKFKNKQLNLLSLITSTNDYEKKQKQQQQKVLLDKCEFAQWLPNSDILIAQSEYNIFIWYNVEDLNEVSKIDARSFNITNLSPILDLSLLSTTKSQLLSTNNGVIKQFEFRKPYPTIIKVTFDCICLSNSQTVPFDKLKVKFYTELLDGKLDSALEVLLSTSKHVSERIKNSLLTKLGWSAINKADCDIAVRVFKELGHISMVKCLEKCLNLTDNDECQWRLAMLKGDWDTFEQIANSEHIIETYKRLNKWSKLISYLNKTQQFRQRDLAEQEYREWLIERGRISEAAEMLANASDLGGAIELLINNEKYAYATELFLKEQKAPLSDNVDNNKVRNHIESQLIELAKKLKSKLLELNDYNNVAKVCDKILAQFDEAIQFYVKANNFQDAIRMLKVNNNSNEMNEERIFNLEELFANHLINQFRENKLSRKKALPAIDHLLNGQKYSQALEVAVELKDFQQAYDILVNYNNKIPLDEKDDKIKEYSKSIVKFMLDKGSINEAANVYLICGNYQEVIELCIKQADYKRAYDIALNYVYDNNKNDTVEYFIKLAKDLIEKRHNNDNSREQAERIYLILDKPELAIELNKNTKNYDRMFELIEQYQPDALESNLLILARQMETEGKFSDAEKYLLKASDTEWTNVVRMYRLANKLPDAYRVAREHCSSEKDPLLVQLAYWWSKYIYKNDVNSLNEAQELLKKLNVFNLVVEFCCDNKNYQFAIELCSIGDEKNYDDNYNYLKLKQKDIIKRYAQYLEEMHKYQQAEEMLIKYNEFDAAVNMYIDNDLYQDAIRIVENQLNRFGNNLITEDKSIKQQQNRIELVDLLNSTLIKCANRISEEAKVSKRLNQQQQLIVQSSSISAKSLEKLQKAQQMFLRAQRPDLAVEMYKERGLWQEAIQVAQRFAPQLLESVENDLDNQVVDDISEIVAQVNLQQQQANQSRSSSSSRSSLLSYQSSSHTKMYNQNNSTVATTIKANSNSGISIETINRIGSRSNILNKGQWSGFSEQKNL